MLLQAPAFPVLTDLPSPELRELVMPMFTPFQLLITPCTAMGAGIQLKRTPHAFTAAPTNSVHWTVLFHAQLQAQPRLALHLSTCACSYMRLRISQLASF